MQGVFISAIKYLDQKSHVPFPLTIQWPEQITSLRLVAKRLKTVTKHEIFSITNPLQFFFNMILLALHVTKISQSYDYRERYPSHFSSVNKNVVVN